MCNSVQVCSKTCITCIKAACDAQSVASCTMYFCASCVSEAARSRFALEFCDLFAKACAHAREQRVVLRRHRRRIATLWTGLAGWLADPLDESSLNDQSSEGFTRIQFATSQPTAQNPVLPSAAPDRQRCRINECSFSSTSPHHPHRRGFFVFCSRLILCVIHSTDSACIHSFVPTKKQQKPHTVFGEHLIAIESVSVIVA